MSWLEPPPPADKPPEMPKRPAWSGPPENEIGVALPTRLALYRSDQIAVVIQELVAYTTGFEIAVSTRLRTGFLAPGPGMFNGPLQPGKPLPAELFRFGIEFADGTRGSNLARGAMTARKPDDPPPAGPLLMPRGGGGGGNRYDFRYWIWPLPPPGPITLACEWPAKDVPLTTKQLDATPILDAAQRSEKLWPAD